MTKFNGTLVQLAQTLPDHEVICKVVEGEMKVIEVLQYEKRVGRWDWERRYQSGRQVVMRWVEIESKVWEGKVEPQSWRYR